MLVFGGSSNQGLAESIAKTGKWTLGRVSLSKFENDEKRVSVGRGSGSAAIIQSLSRPVDEHLIEFCLLSDALTRAGYSEVVGVIPWLGYSKQDKIFMPGEALSAKVVAQIIQTTKIKKLITFDLHNRAITGFFDIPVVELSAKPLFLEYFREKIEQSGEWVVVAPDEGAVKSSAYFAKELGLEITYMDKRRDLSSGEVRVVGMSGDLPSQAGVKGKNVIIVDDMIVTGSTMVESAKYLKGKGAQSVSVAATHHLYVPGAQEKLEKSEIDEIVVTDSVQQTTDSRQQNSQPSAVSLPAQAGRKLSVLSVVQLIVDELA